MRRYLIGVEYVGTNFCGSAATIRGQVGVQNVVENAFKEVYEKKKVPTTWACRTDAGAHALFNAFQVDLPHEVALTPSKMVKQILLPTNLKLVTLPIRLHSICEVPQSFSANRMCRSRTYLYRLSTCPTIPVSSSVEWQRLWVCGYRGRYNLDKMREAAEILLGEHDYVSFTSKSGQEKAGGTVKSVDKIEIFEVDPPNFSASDVLPGIRLPQYVNIEITGRTFLHRQVLRMVGCLENVGRGEIDKETVSLWLSAHDRKAVKSAMAPPHGAYVKKLVYNEKYVKWTHLDHQYANSGSHKEVTENDSGEGVEEDDSSDGVEGDDSSEDMGENNSTEDVAEEESLSDSKES